MKRMQTWAIVMLAGAAVAGYELFTGWLVARSGVPVLIVFFGVFFGPLSAMAAAIAVAWLDRSRIISGSPSPQAAVAAAARGVNSWRRPAPRSSRR